MAICAFPKWHTAVSTAVVLLTLLAVTACSGNGDKPPETDLDVTLTEWEIAVDPSTMIAGTAILRITHAGAIPHNLVVVKSDLPPAELPTVDGELDTPKLHVIASSGPLRPREDPQVTEWRLDLTPGKYVLVCDVVTQTGSEIESHYKNGMFAPLLVEP